MERNQVLQRRRVSRCPHHRPGVLRATGVAVLCQRAQDARVPEGDERQGAEALRCRYRRRASAHSRPEKGSRLRRGKRQAAQHGLPVRHCRHWPRGREKVPVRALETPPLQGHRRQVAAIHRGHRRVDNRLLREPRYASTPPGRPHPKTNIPQTKAAPSPASPPTPPSTASSRPRCSPS